jgi:hypothetical protein
MVEANYSPFSSPFYLPFSHLFSLLVALDAASGVFQGAYDDTEVLTFKFLCPPFAIGLLIGRGGTVINQMISQSGADIKLSKNGEYWPTSNDRVILSKCTRIPPTPPTPPTPFTPPIPYYQ